MQDKATLKSDPSGIQGYTFCRGQASDVPITTGWNLILQKSIYCDRKGGCRFRQPPLG